MKKQTITKRYENLPAAHRQPNHDGHCRLIHGHNWAFDITLQCVKLDENGFVVDVGKMKLIRSWLENRFDHTLLLNADDPIRGESQLAVLQQLSKVVIVDNCGMEGLARYVLEHVNILIEHALELEDWKERGVQVVSVTCFEDTKNSATCSLV
ncbi:MAG: putative 6-carboxy-5 6 7 8-tetrahydropterin synthase [Prokaryotic dsDNA virus sp.]|nr:MAG: putative 6-carboxy-5 6 7 8-tetrahydropterin synthase [Prokaryotic dsDNA virus sp.]|tara:strand:- start:13660 stop:14118 length:459 start_codon:yes stop_codon:yes gene_type:complete